MSEHTGTHFSLHEVSVQYDHCRALDSVSLRVERGERIALLGPSGAGKSTLLGLLNGSVHPSSGQVTVAGSNLAALSAAALREHRSEIGFVYQDYNLVPNLRVLQNVLSGRLGTKSLFSTLRMLLLPSSAEREEVYAILEQVGIPEKLYQPVQRLSGGQQQRVAVARALFQTPSLLLADEPVSSVDPARARETLRLFFEIADARNLTLGVSLHDVELAREFFPRIIGMRGGKIEFDVSSEQCTEEMLQGLFDLNANDEH